MSIVDLFQNEIEYEGWKFFQGKNTDFSIMSDLDNFGVLSVDEDYLSEKEAKKHARDSD